MQQFLLFPVVSFYYFSAFSFLFLLFATFRKFRTPNGLLYVLRCLRHLLYWPEICYCAITNNCGLLIAFSAHYWLFERLWLGFWYPRLAGKQDHFRKLTASLLYFLSAEIYWKSSVGNLIFLFGLFSAFIGLLLIDIWLTQHLIHRNHTEEMVLVGTGGAASSGDSAHLLVQIGSETFEIFKEGGVFKAQIVPHQRRTRPLFPPWQHYYVPTLSYGIMGRYSGPVDGNLRTRFNSLLAKIGPEYHSSYQSCQEVALEFATSVVEPEDAITLSLTMSKSLLLTLSYFFPIFLIVFLTRVHFSLEYTQ